MVSKSYITVKTEDDYLKMMSHIEQHSLLAYDTEATGLDVRNDKIVGFCISGAVGVGFYLPIYTYNKDLGKIEPTKFYSKAQSLLKVLKGKYLIMHNGSYDVRITKYNFNIDLVDNLAIDTMLLKHTVDEIPPFRLKDIAIKIQSEIGLNVEEAANKEQIALKESILKNGGQVTKSNMEMYKADLDVLGQYGAADADLTFRVYQYYYKKLESENLVDFFFKEEVMPLYRQITIPMEDNGILLDLPKIEKALLNISLDLDDLEDEILESLKLYSKPVEQELMDKLATISTKGTFAQILAKTYNLPLPTSPSGKISITKKNLEKIKNEENKEVVEFLSGNTDISLSFRSKLYEIQKQYYLQKTNQRHVINIRSKPHLMKIFFDQLKEKPLSTTDKGNPQMNDNTLQMLAKKYKSAELLGDYNKLTKIKTAYLDRFLRKHKNGLFYPSFNQAGTISGRYGSDLQQLPRPEDEDSGLSPLVLKYRNMVREFFIAKPGKIFIDVDQEQLEVRVFANDAGDKVLCEMFENNEDPYSKIAIQVNNLQDKYSAKKGDDNFLKKHAPGIRQRAKCFHKDTKVETKEGIKTIKDVKIGDLVKTKFGFKKVLNITERPPSKVGLFITNKGILKCTPDHKIWNISKNAWVEASNFEENDNIEYGYVENIKNNKNPMLPIWSNASYKNGASKPIGYMEFNDDWGYILGAYIGDGVGSYTRRKEYAKRGYNSHLLSTFVGICGLKEDGIIDHWKNLVSQYGYHVMTTIRKEEGKNRKDLTSYIIRDFEFCKIFQSTFNMFKENEDNKLTGAKNLRIPSFVFNSSINTKLAFIAGLLDTDGYLKRNSDSMYDATFCSKDYRLATDLIYLLNTLGSKASLQVSYNKTYKKDYYIVRILRVGIEKLNELGIKKYIVCDRKRRVFDFPKNYKAKNVKKPDVFKRYDVLEEFESTYDITVVDVSEFEAAGIRVHNCYALGIRYGMGNFKLAHSLNQSKEDCWKNINDNIKTNSDLVKMCKKLYIDPDTDLDDLFKLQMLSAEIIIQNYFKNFPGLKASMDKYIQQAIKYGIVCSSLGRVRHMPELRDLLRKYTNDILDPMKTRALASKLGVSSEEIKKARKKAKSYINNALNFPIQANAASIINRAAIAISEAFKDRKINGVVCAQVHDQLIIEVDESQKDEAKQIVQDLMENTTKLEHVDLQAPPELSKNFKEGH